MDNQYLSIDFYKIAIAALVILNSLTFVMLIFTRRDKNKVLLKFRDPRLVQVKKSMDNVIITLEDILTRPKQ